MIIHVSNNTLHQISSHIFGIFIKEILNYMVVYKPIAYSGDPIKLTEKEKLYDTLDQIAMYVDHLHF